MYNLHHCFPFNEWLYHNLTTLCSLTKCFSCFDIIINSIAVNISSSILLTHLCLLVYVCDKFLKMKLLIHVKDLIHVISLTFSKIVLDHCL